MLDYGIHDLVRALACTLAHIFVKRFWIDHLMGNGFVLWKEKVKRRADGKSDVQPTCWNIDGLNDVALYRSFWSEFSGQIIEMGNLILISLADNFCR